jgi:hypothetical protein
MCSVLIIVFHVAKLWLLFFFHLFCLYLIIIIIFFAFPAKFSSQFIFNMKKKTFIHFPSTRKKKVTNTNYLQ